MNLTKWFKHIIVFPIIIAGLLIYGSPIYAQHASGENTYKQLLAFAEKGDNAYIILLLTFTGMVVGALVPRLLKVSNYQVRAISLETGLRNASLAMTIALLIQDSMGDFHSSMFWVSGMFGITMYIAGLVAIKVYPKIFPIEEMD